MSFFTQEQIDDNYLYGDYMEEVNKLYDKHDCPPELPEGENRTTTTGDLNPRPHYISHDMGDWEGYDIDAVAEYANNQRDEALSYQSNYYYLSEKYADFEKECFEEINLEEYDRYAWTLLCEAPEEILDDFLLEEED